MSVIVSKSSVAAANWYLRYLWIYWAPINAETKNTADKKMRTATWTTANLDNGLGGLVTIEVTLSWTAVPFGSVKKTRILNQDKWLLQS